MSESLLQQAVRKHGIEAVLKSLSPADRERLPYVWEAWARPEQLEPPGDWYVWLYLAGRGAGKTRTAVEWIRKRVQSGKARNLIIAGPTAGDVRDVMVEGESGILAKSSPDFRPIYEPSKLRLTWPNGAVASLVSADEPDRFRGRQGDTAWLDELASWRYDTEAFDMMMYGLRLGSDPRIVVTTTPRPTALIKQLFAARDTHVTRGSTFDNAANLAPQTLAKLKAQYDGTRLGRQELYAEILDDSPGALWKRSAIDAGRVPHTPDLARVVVAVDPAVSSHGRSDETGIIVVGAALCSCNGTPERHAFVLDDRSSHYTPAEWARVVLQAYLHHGADRIIAETNQGGALVEANLRTVSTTAAFSAIHATRGKRVRAEPVAALYEQGKVHHVGTLPALEDQLCAWDPLRDAYSPDRLDALVYAITELMLGEAAPSFGTQPFKAPSWTFSPAASIDDE